jgi:DNA mismatch repair ATPase MutS
MNPKQQAVTEIRKFQRMFGAMVEVADVLEKVGDLEQAAAEAEGRRDAAARDLDKLKAEAAAASAKAKDVTDAANQALVDAKAEAESVLSAARDQAAQIKADAEAQANKSIDDAAAKLTGLNGEIAERLATLDGLREEIGALQERRDKVQAGIDKLAARLNG